MVNVDVTLIDLFSLTSCACRVINYVSDRVRSLNTHYASQDLLTMMVSSWDNPFW